MTGLYVCTLIQFYELKKNESVLYGRLYYTAYMILSSLTVSLRMSHVFTFLSAVTYAQGDKLTASKIKSKRTLTSVAQDQS